MSSIYGPRKGFNHAKSGNPRGRDKPYTFKPMISTDSRHHSTRSTNYINSFLCNELDPDSFHAEVDKIKADRLENPIDPHKFWREL